MAHAIICDRCGKIYKTTADCQYTLFNEENSSDPLYRFEYRGKLVGQPMDLCDNCLFQLAAWVSAGSME